VSKTRKALTGVCLPVAACLLLCGPAATWLQVRERRVDGSGLRPDIVYLVAGARAQQRRVDTVVSFLVAFGPVPVIVGNDATIASWSTEHQRNLNVAEWARLKLERAAVTAQVDVLPSRARTTDDEMATLARYLDGRPEVRTVALVTSPFHARRVVTRLQHHLERDVRIGLVLPAVSFVDRNPIVVLIELVKLLRDALGLSRVPLFSRG